MQDLRDRAAVVTGAGGGIGLGIARALAGAGVDVVVADIEADAAEAAARDLASTGVRTLACSCDVSDRSDVEALAERAWAAFGRIDILVNNAGVFPPIARLVDALEQDVRWVLDVNVMGVWNGCSVFGRRFVDQGSPAHIVNTGSENSLGMAHTGAAAYTASKHAVLGLSDVLRHELPDHIGVSIVCPGMVATRLGTAARNRPARFGGPLEPVGPPGPALGLDPDEVGRLTVEGVRRGDFYIVTHPPVREIVQERCAEILGAFDAHAPRFDGDDRLDTRAIMRRTRGSRRSGPEE